MIAHTALKLNRKEGLLMADGSISRIIKAAIAKRLYFTGDSLCRFPSGIKLNISALRMTETLIPVRKAYAQIINIATNRCSRLRW